MSQLSDLFVGEVFNKTIWVEDTVIINRNLDPSFMFFTVPVFLVTLLVNTCVLMIMWPAESTTVNQLIVLDSINDITLSSLSTFHQSPFYRGLGLEFYCSFHLVLYWTCATCNRLIPVSIAVYRYELELISTICFPNSSKTPSQASMSSQGNLKLVRAKSASCPCVMQAERCG